MTTVPFLHAPTSIRTSRAVRRTGVVVLTAGLALLSAVALPSMAQAAVAPVALGTSAAYSVLGGQTVTNTGPSTLAAGLGVDPGTALTGFPPGLVAGATHAADAPALQAQSDLTIAYDDAAGRAPTASVAGDLVGQTDVAGVYNSTGPLALSGTLTLDGQGNANSVFIFQVASTLITASASYINMINGAQACNVYWQVGSSATLGTNSVFRGTIMALTSISVTTGTTVEGRALARNGQVSLDNNVFTDPSCGTTVPATATSTTLTTSPTSVPAGGTATLTAAVTGTGPTPTGTVTFSDSSGPLATTPLGTSGTAAFSAPAGTTVTTRALTAHFNGNTTMAPSTSAVTNLVVVAAVPAAVVPVTPVGTSSPVSTVGATTTPVSNTGLAETGPSAVLRLSATGTALLLLGGAMMLTATMRTRAPRRPHGRHFA